jgi:hypothetical protein
VPPGPAIITGLLSVTQLPARLKATAAGFGLASAGAKATARGASHVRPPGNILQDASTASQPQVRGTSIGCSVRVQHWNTPGQSERVLRACAAPDSVRCGKFVGHSAANPDQTCGYCVATSGLKPAGV